MNDLTTLCLFGLFILLVVGVSAWMRRNRPAPQGTYDDPNTRSGGSIGGSAGQPGQRTYDDPDLESGGSFGGSAGEAGRRTYDDPDIRSGGSFGGSGSSQGSQGSQQSSLGNRAAGPSRPAAPPPSRPTTPPPSRPASPPSSSTRHDDPDTKSGGSFGG